jgi:hypothetical protein
MGARGRIYLKRLVCLVLVCIGCNGGGGSSTLKIDAVEPNYGPLAGGTRVTLKGEGFLADGAAPNRVVIGGLEAPLAGAIDDDTLEVVIPPGEVPGPVDIIVLNRNGVVTSTGLFHYSDPPVITSVTPGNVVYSSTDTVMTVTGSGFQDEGAGAVQVVVNGRPGIDVEVRSDTELVFTALPGTLLTGADIQITNARGVAEQPNAFRYAPGPRGGLLLFPDPSTGVFLQYFDPIDNSTVTVRRLPTSTIAKIRSVVRDDAGEYWAADRGGRWGRIDMKTQTLITPVQTSIVSALARNGASYYALDRSGRFGTFDPVLGKHTITNQTPSACCNGQGNQSLAIDAAGVIYVGGQAPAQNGTAILRTYDTSTNTYGTPVTLTATAPHIVEARFYNGVLYGAQKDGTILTIDPATGGTSIVGTVDSIVSALEILP